MTRAEASRRRIQEALKRPAFHLLSLRPDDSTTATASPQRVRGCRYGRLPFVSVVTGFPAMLRSDHDDRGPADRVEDR
jgi:hypothetical protein